MKSISKRKKTIVVFFITPLIIISTFLMVAGCLEEEMEEPEDVFIDLKKTEFENHDTREDIKIIRMKVEMTNEKDEHIQLDRTSFELETERGFIYADPKEEEMIQYLEPGDTTEFWLIFELTEEHEPKILWFAPVDEEEPVSWAEI